MNAGLVTGLAIGGAGLALGAGAALLDKPGPQEPNGDLGNNQPTAQSVWVGLMGAAIISGLFAGPAMLASQGKGHTIPKLMQEISFGVAGGFAAAATGTGAVLHFTSKAGRPK